jgi:hypothetical protein
MLPEFHADRAGEKSGEEILHIGSREIEVDFNCWELDVGVGSLYRAYSGKARISAAESSIYLIAVHSHSWYTSKAQPPQP